MIPLYIYLGAVFALSAAAFIAYGADKSKARRGAWRIPEKVLLGLSFFGGAAGKRRYNGRGTRRRIRIGKGAYAAGRGSAFCKAQGGRERGPRRPACESGC